jgi:hypothetical protein
MKYWVNVWLVFGFFVFILAIEGCTQIKEDSSPPSQIPNPPKSSEQEEEIQGEEGEAEGEIEGEEIEGNEEANTLVSPKDERVDDSPSPLANEECSIRHVNTDEILEELRETFNHGYNLPCRQLGINGTRNDQKWWLVFKKGKKIQLYNGTQQVPDAMLDLTKEDFSFITLLYVVKEMVKLAQPEWKDEQVFEAFYPASTIKSKALPPPDEDIKKGQYYITNDKTEVYWGRNLNQETDVVLMKLNGIQRPFRVDYDLQRGM